MTRPVLAVALAAVLLPAATASAQAPAAGPTITAVGTASKTPKPVDPHSNASIAKAVRDAQAAVLPLAVVAGRSRAAILAKQAGFALGALVAESEQSPTPFFGYYGIDGTFGPGRYCGNVARFRTTRSASGRVTRKRIGTRRVCRIPRVGTSVSVTYATTAPAA